jgi:hypothetical protein
MTNDEVFWLAVGLVALVAILGGAGGGGHLAELAEAIAEAEGYGVPGAIPTVRNNPGDLKIGGGSITTFATAAEGWAALYRQLELIRDGGSAYYSPTMTLSAFSRVWTATEQGAWLANVLEGLQSRGVVASAGTQLDEVL